MTNSEKNSTVKLLKMHRVCYKARLITKGHIFQGTKNTPTNLSGKPYHFDASIRYRLCILIQLHQCRLGCQFQMACSECKSMHCTTATHCTVQNTLHTAHCTLHTAHSTLQNTLHIAQPQQSSFQEVSVSALQQCMRPWEARLAKCQKQCSCKVRGAWPKLGKLSN